VNAAARAELVPRLAATELIERQLIRAPGYPKFMILGGSVHNAFLGADRAIALQQPVHRPVADDLEADIAAVAASPVGRHGFSLAKFAPFGRSS
jgi:hypothetical protein